MNPTHQEQANNAVERAKDEEKRVELSEKKEELKKLVHNVHSSNRSEEDLVG